MPLFLMGCFSVDFQDVKRPLRTKSVKRPIPRVCKPWFPNRGSRLPAEERLKLRSKRGKKEVKQR